MLSIYKKKGQTPLQALDELRKINPELKNETLSYAGRLDPLAEGLMLVLVGEKENQQSEKDRYLDLDKEYEIEVLLGIETDTYDALGIPHPAASRATLSMREGTFLQPYPPYSSFNVKGKPLFQYAREGKLGEIEIPTKEVTIYSIEELKDKEREISSGDLLKQVFADIDLIAGDFRQEEIKKSWAALPSGVFKIISLRIKCSSGTYMRSFAHNMGGIALKIVRTKVGEYEINETM